ncbi:hypothetical protein AVEN_195914-1 [Araneus ventricosus]|uniref:Tc1-like transposase DDE domain-containing protein n=1 Tax=Araneus ventricosus TaxID=182803 RepID=A0A4Y2WK04_ARAVE|nr:hypothetical protein AVEN_195914-1 [Araneus ventricosus]
MEFIDPFFLSEKTIHGDIDLDILEIFTIPQIESYDNMIFQQDSALPHWSTSVLNCLNQHFSNGWIGQGFVTSSIARFNPLDFFMWECDQTPT